MKLIINADDCGKNKEVNAAISHFIETGKITSTTVMANMDDLEGPPDFLTNIRIVFLSGYTSI